MKDLVIIGAGGFGREVAQLIEDINSDKNTWNLLGFIDEFSEKNKTVIYNYPVLGGLDWFEDRTKNRVGTVCAIGNPKDKYRLLERAAAYEVDFVNLIHPNAKTNKYAEFGWGCIVCGNSFISVNTKIGNHVSINPGCGIGHDTVVGDYSSLYWNVTLSGNVSIGQGCEIGSNACVIPKRTVGKWSVIGAGAVVIKDLPDNCIAVGIPARPIRFS